MIRLIPAILFAAALPLLAAAPAAPTGLEASDGSYSNKIALSWEHVRDAQVYRVFRSATNDAGSATAIGTTPSITFTDSLSGGLTFFYWVRAENTSGNSPLSAADAGSTASGPGPLVQLTLPAPPSGNVTTGARVYLGKTLFWDEQLSSTKTVACGTCHIPRAGGSDPRAVKDAQRARHPGADGVFGTADDVTGSIGVPLTKADGSYQWSSSFGLNPQVTPRHANSAIDAAFAQVGLFWDGRATPQFNDPESGAVLFSTGAALESQAVAPLLSSVEMGHDGRTIADVVARVTASKPLALSPSIPGALSRWIGGRNYSELFTEAFGTSEITGARIAMALASYERTLLADRTDLDRGPNPLTSPAGFPVFQRNGCAGCHQLLLGSDDEFHVTGVRPFTEDLGRATVTGAPRDQGAFRSPSVRNAGIRPALQHTGRMSLEEVVAFYDRGGDFRTSPGFPRGVFNPLNLSAQDKISLTNFLRYQTVDERAARESAPLFDRPVLYSESARVPVLTGSGTADAVGRIPEMVALEPPYAGNARFTIAVGNIAPGARAVLAIDRVDPALSAKPGAALIQTETTASNDGAGHGFASASVSITSDLTGTFYARWFITANGQTAISRAARFTVFSGDPSSETFTSLNAGSLVKGTVARGSIVSGFGTNLAGTTVSAPAGTLPTTLGTVRVSITDRNGVSANAPLFFVSAGQINYLVPATLSEGEAEVSVFRADAMVASGKLQIAGLAPSLFTANSNGRDAAAALVAQTPAAGAQTTSSTVTFDAGLQRYIPQPIALGGANDQTFLLLFGTGIRGANSVTATIGDTAVDVLYSGPQNQYEGLDQVNLRLPRSLAGRGEMDVALWVDGVRANTVRISVQ